MKRRWFNATLFLILLAAVHGQAQTCVSIGAPVNGAPLAADDVAFLPAGAASIVIPVLANDVYVTTDSIRIVTGACTGGGTTSVSGAAVTYTPGPQRADDGFDYTLNDDSSGQWSMAHVTVHSSSHVTVSVSVQSLVATVTVTATPPTGILNTTWIWGDGITQVTEGADKYTHQYQAGGTFHAEVKVRYQSGEVVSSGLFDVVVVATDHSTFHIGGRGLNPSVDILLNPYTSGTRVMMNWSPNAADCSAGCGTTVDGQGHVGPLFTPGPDGTGQYGMTCVTTCQLVAGYFHSGDYKAILRITTGATSTDYPFSFNVVNAVPVVGFSFTRPDPNARRIVFDVNGNGGLLPHISDDGPFPLTPFEWDFGDGTTWVDTTTGYDHPTDHTFTAAGTFPVTLKITDGDGSSGLATIPVTVSNAPPVPKITVHCRVLDCTFGSEPSTDDGNNISGWQWTFSDGSSASGATAVTTFGAAGCIDVALQETDGDGGTATVHKLVPVGPPLTLPAGGVTADAHVQSFQSNGQWLTTDGNLNGIVEPGETVVVEPAWTSSVPVTAYTARVALPGDPPSASPRNGDIQFLGNAATYAVTAGKTDCWSGGQCYAVKVLDDINNQHDGRHMDVTVQELDASTGQPTAGSGFLLHLGRSFTDVPTSHWAYPFVESILHAGLDGGCGGTAYCPVTAVTRADAAVWLLKAEHGAAYQPPACAVPPFNDVPCTLAQAAWIGQLKAEGLTSGTGGGNYTPAATVSRSDFTTLLLRTRLGAAWVPPACHADFGDVQCPGNAAADWISAAKAMGISNGCSPTEYCPADGVDRAQAAALTSRTFNLRIDAKQCVPDPAYDGVPGHPIPSPIASLTFSASPVVAPTTSTGTITLGAPVAVATNIPLTIDLPSAASVPATVHVNAYQTTGTFAVTPAAVAVRTTVKVTASYENTTKTSQLDICTPPPTISVQPASKSIDTNQTTTLSVTASGGGDLTYQWYTASAAINSATASTLSVTPPATASYYVVVTNACGSTTSATATVTVCTPPSITTQPPSQIVSLNSSATLTVGTGGSGPWSYQWYEGTSGTTTNQVSTSATFITPPLTANKSYWVKVTSTCNGTRTVNSNTATVTVVSSITRVQSAAATAQSMTSISATWPIPTHANNLLVASISAANSSYPIATITPLPGWQLATTYEWNNVKTSIYYLTNNGGGRTIETFTIGTAYRDMVLEMAEYTWMATSSPLDQVNFNGAFNTSSLVVSPGTTGTTVQANELVVSSLAIYTNTSFSSPTNSFTEVLDRNIGTDLAAALHERITTTSGAYGHNATTGADGQWTGVIASFKGATGPVTPAPIASLTFSPSPVAGGSTSTGTITLGTAPATAVTIPLTVDNTTALTVPSSVTVNANQTTGTFTVTGGTVTTRTTVNVTATYLGAPKTTALDVCPPAPAITTQPTSRTINANQSTTLSVAATGSPLTYQWYQGTAPSGTQVSSATSATLTVTPPSTTSYWVAVSNGCGTTASNTATVTVCLPPGIVTQPQSQTVAPGGTATLSVTPSGSGPLSYQWYAGTTGTTTTLVGTGNTFTTPALFANASYWVRVISACNGNAVADSATATINVVSQITRVQTSGAAVQSLTGVTATWPSATHAGNLLVAAVSAANSSYPIATFTPPPGWQLAATYEWNNVKTSIYYYPSNPGARTSETFSAGTYRDLVLQLAEYSGVMSASPLDRTAFDGAASPSGGIVDSGTTSTTSQAKELVVTAIGTYTPATFSSPSNSFTKIQDQAAGFDLAAALFDRVVSTAGTYGHTASVSASSQWVGLVVTFKSADTSAALARPPAVRVASTPPPPAPGTARSSRK